MSVWAHSLFTNGQLLHTLDYLEDNRDRILELTEGTSWTWTQAGNEVYPSPPWERDDFVEFVNGQVFVTWLYHRPH